MINHKTIIFTLLILKFNFSLAQKDSVANEKFDRFFISFSGGVSLPVDSFTENDRGLIYNQQVSLTNSGNNAGPAGTGITGRLNLNYFFAEAWGCVAVIYANRFETKEKTKSEFLGPQFNTGIINTDYSYEAKPWVTWGYMGGLVMRLPFDKSSISLKFLCGSQYSVMPETNIMVKNYYDNNYVIINNYTQLSASSTNFVWNAGIDYTLKVGKYILVLCSADYTRSSTAEFEGKSFNTSQSYLDGIAYYNHTDNIYSYKFTKPITYISLTAGIAYIFK